MTWVRRLICMIIGHDEVRVINEVKLDSVTIDGEIRGQIVDSTRPYCRRCQ